MRAIVGLLAATLIPAASVNALACPHKGHAKGPMHRCAKMLMHAHADVLQSKLGLDDAQLKRIEAVRSRFMSDKANIEAAMVKERANGHSLWQTDLPQQDKLLAHVRKMQQLRAKKMEGKVKTMLAIMKLMKREQRRKLRETCFKGPGPGPGPGIGKGEGPKCGGDCPNCGRGGCPKCGRGRR